MNLKSFIPAFAALSAFLMAVIVHQEQTEWIQANINANQGPSLTFQASGNDPNTFPLSFLEGAQNDYAVEDPDSSGTPIPLQLQRIFQDDPNAILQNGAVYDHYFLANDGSGKQFVLIKEARHWNQSTLSDPAHTPEPYYSIFQNSTDLTSCLTALTDLQNSQRFFQTAEGFQLFLDLVSLCQR